MSQNVSVREDSDGESSAVENTSPAGQNLSPRPDEGINKPFAPSDFLKHLPPSTERPSVNWNSNTTTASSNKPLLQTGPSKHQVDADGRTLNPRSCVTCRKRKVKCDKTHPCANCNRAHIECVFPSPGRAPRKKRKFIDSKDKELLERLRRLEGVVKGLGVDVPNALGEGDDTASKENKPLIQSSISGPEKATDKEIAEPAEDDAADQFRAKTRWIEEQKQGRFEQRFGRLVINEGRSRYVNNSFWASLSNEVEDLKGILNQSSDEEDTGSPNSNPNSGIVHQGWMFGYSSQSIDMLNLHPLPSQIEIYWELYKDRVDPLVKVLHIPTLEPTVLSAASRLSNLSKGFEALLFAIYYGTVTSLNAEDCLAKLGEDRSVLLARYRFAVEQALARTNFLTTEETIVLQAFVIFLICLRRNCDARVIWTLTGLVVRIAQTIGIHRDGSHFALPAFEVEMRRRLWWQVCILDTRASEDHGCDPTIIEQSFDTQMPLNINDVDIWPGIKELPAEKLGCTDMSFCLIRFEVANTSRRINYVPPGPSRPSADYFDTVTLQDKERWITQCHQRLEVKYLKHCDMSIPLFWVTATVARLMMSKMWLMVYHPFQRQDGGASLPAETKDKLFITSLENIEYSALLETEARTMKWGWLFKTYMQWHALAFILSELCRRTSGDLVDRAWVAIDNVCGRRFYASVDESAKAGHLWRPLQKLYRKAREARQLGIQDKENAVNQRPGSRQVPERRYSPNANPMFENPNRPRMVQAPLSQAQLRRFTDGPEFGQVPLDKHELLMSLKAANGDPMDVTDLPPATNDEAIFPNQRNPMLSAVPKTTAINDQQYYAPTTTSTYTGNGLNQNLMNTPGTMDFSFSGSPATDLNQPKLASAVLDQPNDLLMDGIESNSSDLPILDPSGDLDWENWDQLVRQFGTNIDGAGDGTAAWNSPNWEMGTSGPNLRMGMGMGGGDWF
ncbi:Bikaverin cluster transcription factor bik5 [Acrodontium crateriforme]|uniref:Bikaverin cluster transcription factor bik5 n=1 Tax=Acrodontium crateriforme TaxID=150365 RepID=A0AAQ3R2Z6_9PEZI|nr:Bikaverin cluster transcription factor bik5 [Acrodontium crateriforme]